MPMTLVRIDGRRIVDDGTFHDVFDEAFGFPGYYGRNMSAWVDCMTYLDDPSAGMTRIHAADGGVVTLQIDHAADLKLRCPELLVDVVECSAFVNWRRVERGEEPVLALSMHV